MAGEGTERGRRSSVLGASGALQRRGGANRHSQSSRGSGGRGEGNLEGAWLDGGLSLAAGSVPPLASCHTRSLVLCALSFPAVAARSISLLAAGPPALGATAVVRLSPLWGFGRGR